MRQSQQSITIANRHNHNHNHNNISNILNSGKSSKPKHLKWLNYYQPTVNINATQYHFVSQPYNSQKYQKVTVSQQQSIRPISMYFQIQDLNDIKKHMNQKKEDKSGLKDFAYLNFLQKEQKIVLNRQQTINDSIWAKKYQPKAFYQLLTDQTINRNVLTWLKSWDKIVFNKQSQPIMPTTRTLMANKHNPQLGQLGSNNSYNTSFNNNYNTNNYNTNKIISTYNQYNHNKLILLSGPPGCGKTTLARVLAKHCGYDYTQLNASDDRSAKNLIEKIQALGKINSISNNKPTMIIIDQVDGALQQDGNGIKQVLNYIQYGSKSQKEIQKFKQKEREKDKPFKKQYYHHQQPRPQDLAPTQYVHHQKKHTIIQRPIIFICNDPFVKGLKQLRLKSIVIYFRIIQKQRIVRRLKQITQQEKIYIENQVLTKIAQISNCDIRGSLSILEYICNSKRLHNQNPKDLINKLKLSFSKDSNTSIMEFISSLLNQTKMSGIKHMVNLRQFSYSISKIDNLQLMMQMFFHNFTSYKNFFIKKTKQCIKLYQFLKWVDIIVKDSFRFNNQIDSFIMILFLYYRMMFVNEEVRKIQFPSQFFERLNRQKQNKEIIQQLTSKWPSFLRSTLSTNTIIKDYIYLLYYSVQTSSPKDSDVIECVGRMLTYGIHLAPRNAFNLFKPQFDALLTFGGKKLEILYSNISRTLIEQSYQFAKLKSHLLEDLSLLEINKNTEELLSQLNIKNKKRKRNPESTGNNTIKYKFIEGSGTQITYDLKFRFFFE